MDQDLHTPREQYRYTLNQIFQRLNEERTNLRRRRNHTNRIGVQGKRGTMIRSLSQNGDLQEQSNSQTRHLRDDIQSFYNDEEEKKSAVDEIAHSHSSKRWFNYVSANTSFTVSNDLCNEQSSIVSDEVKSNKHHRNPSKESITKDSK